MSETVVKTATAKRATSDGQGLAVVKRPRVPEMVFETPHVQPYASIFAALASISAQAPLQFSEDGLVIRQINTGRSVIYHFEAGWAHAEDGSEYTYTYPEEHRFNVRITSLSRLVTNETARSASKLRISLKGDYPMQLGVNIAAVPRTNAKLPRLNAQDDEEIVIQDEEVICQATMPAHIFSSCINSVTKMKDGGHMIVSIRNDYSIVFSSPRVNGIANGGEWSVYAGKDENGAVVMSEEEPPADVPEPEPFEMPLLTEPFKDVHALHKAVRSVELAIVMVGEVDLFRIIYRVPGGGTLKLFMAAQEEEDSYGAGADEDKV